jgi:hypothetical protein
MPVFYPFVTFGTVRTSRAAPVRGCGGDRWVGSDAEVGA